MDLSSTQSTNSLDWFNGACTVTLITATTTLQFKNNSEENTMRDMHDTKWSHYGVLHRLLNYMRNRDWEIESDISTDKIIRQNYWIGKKGDLECCVHRYPRGFEFEFFQNVVFDNPNGGRFDFDKYRKMPYLVRLSFLNETRRMIEFLENVVPALTTVNYTLGIKTAEQFIKEKYVNSLHKQQKDVDCFELEDLNGKTCDEYIRYAYDRDGKIIRNGDIKYFRDFSGYLARCKVYHNINNMWWCILNDTTVTNEAAFNLFDATTADFTVRRKHRKEVPEKYQKKRKIFSECSYKELVRELRRRDAGN